MADDNTNMSLVLLVVILLVAIILGAFYIMGRSNNKSGSVNINTPSVTTPSMPSGGTSGGTSGGSTTGY